MAGRFVELKEAAKILGMSPEELVDLRAEGGIHGYRDGAGWKFKSEEIDRVAAERGVEMNADPTMADESSSSDLIDSGELDDLISLADLSDGSVDDLSSDSSILVSEEELGPSPDAGASSTVIGAKKNGNSADSDIQLADSGSSVAGSSNLGDSSVDDGSHLGSGVDSSSDISLGSGSSLISGSDVSGSSDLLLNADGGTGDLDMGSSGDELDLDLDSNEDEVIDSAELELSDDSDFQLSSDDLILTSSGGSDVTMGTGDSGINLASPSDSGLSLEDEALDLSDSSSSGLELPEDESDIIALDESLSDSLPDLKEGDFLLSPSDEMSSDESDSGSQVIALEDSEAFDSDSSQALLQPVDQPALIPEEPGVGAGPALTEIAPGAEIDPNAAAAATAPGAQPQFAPAPAAEEAPYSIWNVMGLMLIFAILLVTGTMMFDIVRNMWGWDRNLQMSSTIMDSVIEMMGLK